MAKPRAGYRRPPHSPVPTRGRGTHAPAARSSLRYLTPMPRIALLSAFLAAVPLAAQQPAASAPTDSVPLYTDLGTLHHPVTASPAAQAYFDQGLRLMYGFNHEEAINSFQQGLRLDPGCAMCHWGIALALGPNINAPMDPALERQAADEAAAAAALAPRITGPERAYIAAVGRRYS